MKHTLGSSYLCIFTKLQHNAKSNGKTHNAISQTTTERKTHDAKSNGKKRIRSSKPQKGLVKIVTRFLSHCKKDYMNSTR